MNRPLVLLLIAGLGGTAGLIAGCVATTATVGADTGRVVLPDDGSLGGSLIPAGYGTLRQDEFTISIRSGTLLIKVTPLDESVIRLAAPDTYDRLHAAAESRRAEASAAVGRAPALFLVSFFSYQPDTPFQPEDLQLMQQGRLFRPRSVHALTPGWGAQRLRQQETQTAVFAFDPELDFDLPLVVHYGAARGDSWRQTLPRLRSERARVVARSGG